MTIISIKRGILYDVTKWLGVGATVTAASQNNPTHHFYKEKKKEFQLAFSFRTTTQNDTVEPRNRFIRSELVTTPKNFGLYDDSISPIISKKKPEHYSHAITRANEMENESF